MFTLPSIYKNVNSIITNNNNFIIIIQNTSKYVQINDTESRIRLQHLCSVTVTVQAGLCTLLQRP